MVLVQRKITGLSPQKATLINDFKSIFALAKEETLGSASHFNFEKIL